jgi:hypothetical protein
MLAWPLLAAGLLALLWAAYSLGQRTGPARVFSAGPRIEEVRKIAKLAVLRVQVADVIEGRNAGGRALVLVRGDADMTIDLDQIEIAARDEASRAVTLTLPTPRPDRPRVDQERTRVYEITKVGLAAFNPFADPRAGLLQDCMRAAQKTVAQAVESQQFVTQAQERAELLLAAFYRELGWSVTIEWKAPAAMDGRHGDRPLPTG